ncbi:hypothetical protein [Maribacter sp. 2308TA10-17]|uniref:hypothetical protein n=1 Tax=Maribacter sp. 2308TA10-17 TaxID=3386276 RepID=UPI0039BCA53C
MKTYFTFCALFALVFLGCSKSDDPSSEVEGGKSIDADYIVLLSKDGILKPQLLNANAEVVTLNPAESSLTEKANPDLSFVDGANFIQYHKDGTCNAQVISHNFKNDTNKEIAAFSDLDDCNLTAKAIAKSDDFLFISYELTGSNSSAYFVRIIDLGASELSAIDVTLDKNPVDLAVANNRLFILTSDGLMTEEHSLSVMDISNNTLIHELDLGFRARRIFTDVQQNIIISNDALHTTLNSATMAYEYTQYDNATAPNFSTSESTNFDLSGRLFYPMNPGENSSYPLVPAIYDFSKKRVTLYAYENFLTEAKRNFEYEIETTATIGYDEANGLMLIGYQKMNSASKLGGLLRIRLAPEPAVIDNIDLDGVPYEIIIN